MKKFLVLVVLACFAALAYADTYEFTVTVANGGTGIALSPQASHLAISTDTAGVGMIAFAKVYSSSGQLMGYKRNPPTRDGVATYPTASDTTLTIYDTSILAWNIFNDVPADSLYFTNATGASIDVKVKTKR